MGLNKGAALERDKYGSSRKALKADALGPGEDVAIITVSDIEEIEIDDPEQETGKRISLVLHSEEYADRGYWLNGKGLDRIIDHYGAVPAKWIGRSVPLVKTRTVNPRQPGVPWAVLWVADGEEWDAILEQAGLAGPKPRAARTIAKRPATKPVAKKRTKR